MTPVTGLSIIVPALNEEGSIAELITRIDATMRQNRIVYEVIVIDDHSTDATADIVRSLASHYPVCLREKKGERGKAYSLLEGFDYAQYDLVAILDADLQYPPESLPTMVQAVRDGVDVVIADRVEQQINFIRKLASKAFAFFFARVLHGLTCDVQSGMKVFRKKILREIALNPTPWTFDLEFLLNARNCGYTIGSVDITFASRYAGSSKIKFARSVIEIGSNAIALKFKRHRPIPIGPESNDSMLGAGVSHNKRRFITHTTLPHHESAVESFSTWQKTAAALVVVLVGVGLMIDPLMTGIAIMAILSAIYFIDTVFNLYLVGRSLKRSPEITASPDELSALRDQNLPVYSILCPLFREAHVLPNFLKAIDALDWPKDKLDVLLLLEEDDPETIDTARHMQLPDFVSVHIVPNSMPKTKPKACNYGLAYVRGEYVVIYDAEDIPEPQQLKKAYLAYQKTPSDTLCLQAKLNYYNPHQNVLTRLFTAEYSLWFDVTLTGLQSINTYIPLGGTSNHFKTATLRSLKGWDPFNVTEDCDLGIRLFKDHLKTAVIDSVTLEEANSNVKNWLRQRSRWIKGYMQTYLVHMRRPISFVRTHGVHALIFQMVVGGKIAFALINPILWITTIAYFALRATVGPTIEALFPPAVFIMAGVSLVFGNFMFLYYYMIGCAKRQHWSLIKYIYLVPVYWLMTSISAYLALYQLIVKPHYWEKTHHGLFAGKRSMGARIAGIREAFARIPQLFVGTAASADRKKAASGGMVLIGAMLISNVLNLLFNAYLGRVLSFEEIGVVIFINTLWYVSMIFIGALSKTINHTTAYIETSENRSASLRFFKRALRQSLYVTLPLSVLWLVTAPALSRFFNLPDITVLLLLTPIFAYGVVAAAHRGLLNGALRFKAVAATFVAEALAKLLIAIGFVYFGLSGLVYLAIPLSVIAAAAVSIMVAQSFKPAVATLAEHHPFPAKFYIASLFAGISSVIFLSLDIILVKHYLAPSAAGEYSLLALVGKMIFFLGSLPAAFLITFVSRDQGRARESQKTFRAVFFSSIALVALGTFALGPLGSYIVPLIFGSKALVIVPALTTYTIAIALFTLGDVIIIYHLAKRQYLFPFISLGLSVLMVFGIVNFHDSIQDIVQVIFGVSALGFAILLTLHGLERRLPFIRQNLLDFLAVFSYLPKTQPQQATSKRILILNWRDTEHSFAGGAEIYIHELARNWVADGHHVTLFCGNDGDSPRNDLIDGVHIVRRGGFYLVYLWASIYYALRFRGSYDIVIDCHNGIPFFTPLYVRKPIYCLMHHVHQEVFRRSLNSILSRIARFLEKDVMPIVYRHIPFITVSESSKSEMLKLGIGGAGISIVSPGVDLERLTPAAKSETPVILYLGRLKAYKSIGVLLRAFKELKAQLPKIRLVIAGSGEESARLKRLADTLGISDAVRFEGHVSEERKISLLQRAWVLVNPSLMEGWAITTIEANACATPVVASNVPGLRDSVRNPHTGYLVPYGDAEAFAAAIHRIITDQPLRQSMMQNAIAWAKNFSWTKTSADVFGIINSLKPAPTRLDRAMVMIFLITTSLLIAVVALFSASHGWARDAKNAVPSITVSTLHEQQRSSIDPSNHYEALLAKLSISRVTSSSDAIDGTTATSTQESVRFVEWMHDRLNTNR